VLLSNELRRHRCVVILVSSDHLTAKTVQIVFQTVVCNQCVFMCLLVFNVFCMFSACPEPGIEFSRFLLRHVVATSGWKSSSSVIVAHPDFRMFVLANRPGFPFLGNDFFGAMGKSN
jgi:hypothetical protein